MRARTLVIALLSLILAPAAVAGQLPSAAGHRSPVSASIPRADFLSPAQIRARLDLARPLTEYTLHPTDESPQPDPDCATNRPEAVESKVYPAQRSRTQAFSYRVPGASWTLEGRTMVLEYRSRAKARAALRRAAASVRAATRYSLVCEAINPIVTGQVPSADVDVRGRSFTWRYHLRAAHAGSWREVIATSGRRLVWVELGREYRADLDWDGSTPAASFPAYPSRARLASLARGAVAKGL
jgi:hypothetical protein